MKKRLCERVYPTQRVTSFGIAPSGWLSPARVADFSESGIGLEVRGVCQADVGDTIRVVNGEAGRVRHARVVRVVLESRSGRRLTRLGCCWVRRDVLGDAGQGAPRAVLHAAPDRVA